MPIFFTLGSGPDDLKGAKRTKSEEQRGYLDEHRTLMRWMERYPDAVCSLTHGFPWRTFLNDEQRAIELPDEIWEPFSNPNVSIEVCFPVRLGRHLRVPLPRGLAHAPAQMLEHIGPANLMWGTDMPFQNRFCTYRQSRQWIEGQFTDWADLSDDDLSLMMGGTAARVSGGGIAS